jgi:hypothetical protein
MEKTNKQTILGLHLSPRAKGSSALLLEHFRKGVEKAGSQMETISVSNLKISGCLECGGCEKTGQCVIDDDMGKIYKSWERSEKIVVAASIFFYDIPAQGKAVIDRSQAFWSRRYILGQNKDGRPGTKGFLLAVGATKGKDLFIPVSLSVKYFFDALAFPKNFSSLFFNKIETPDVFTDEQLEEVEKAGMEFAKS